MGEAELRWVGWGYYCAFLLAIGFFFTIESGPAAMAPVLRRWRHIGRNVALWILLLILTDVVALWWWLGVPGMLTASNGLLTPLRLSPAMQFLIGFVLIDLFQYACHRAFHKLPWLWSLHAVHHSDTQVDASTGLRFHPVEAAIQYSLLTGLLLGLGIPLWVEGARAIIINPMALFQHANFEFPAWLERLGRIVITPSVHRLHHSTEPPEANSNFGSTITLWDRLFGTYREPAAARPAQFGVRGCEDDSWQNVAGMLRTPLRLLGSPR